MQWRFDDGQEWLTVSQRQDGDYQLLFDGQVQFLVSMDGLRIVSPDDANISQETLDILYFNQVLPLALSRQGKLVLHAACIETGDTSLAFVGKSGQGKSTLAASFARNGFSFLTDDGLQIEDSADGIVIRPSRPSIRLWDDSRDAILHAGRLTAPPAEYTSKSRFLADESLAHCDEPRVLRCAYLLGDGSATVPTITPVRPSEAMVELVSYSFLLDIEEREALTRHFSQLSRLVSAVKVFRLDYPREYARLPEVREAILDHAAAI